ncbi:MAG: nucleotide-diphospho-sugar transferase [Ferruginibacter sp.]|uniref:hypothetical protein n=1 Tax=Ferruginibacter sp. TaxID=1940288 RepID=UPI002659DF85|nr:hypothetical protein [Ferruginibacter sp.]MDB5280353.1 nucleotide-diphospho-sugar transferase [Ferruginibacter sp.]
MFETPILLLVFNRPQETSIVFEAIRKIKPAHLYIAADGPRKEKGGEKELCDAVQEIVHNIDWKCSVKTLIRDTNLGCRKAVSEAIAWFFTEVEQGIILEDDCLPDESFFYYCEELLEKYKDDERIISIGGTNLGYTFKEEQSFGFSKFMNMWGWATWRRASILVDYKLETWKNTFLKKLFLQRKLQDNLFDVDYNWIKYWNNYFTLTAAGKIDTWDYQWIFTQLYYNKLSVFPAKNLVKNIGFSGSATHTFHPGHPVSELQLSPISFPLKIPPAISVDMEYENDFIKKIWFSYRRDSLYRILRSDFLNNSRVLKIITFFRKSNFNKV